MSVPPLEALPAERIGYGVRQLPKASKDLGLPYVLEPCPLCLLKQDPENERSH
jgi:hypothetical protein